MPYEHRTAYRHANEEVEGFLGVGSTKAQAKADAMNQIKRKLAQFDFVESADDTPVYDKDRIVNVLSSLTPAEIEAVQKDWRSGARY